MKNQNGISLIALIITIIVMIIIAMVAVGAALNTPDQANYARYCQDYAEIQSAVSAKAATLYGEAFIASTTTGGAPITMEKAYTAVCTMDEVPADWSSVGDTGTVTITDSANMLDMDIPAYVTWYVDVEDGGKLSTSDFMYDGETYNKPAATAESGS